MCRRLLLPPILLASVLTGCGGPTSYNSSPTPNNSATPYNNSPTPYDKSKATYEAYQAGDYTTALRLYRSLAEQGDARAQNNLGWMYAEGKGVPKDEASAIFWLRKAAEQGDAPGQHNLGWMYEKAQKFEIALFWYRLAANQSKDDAVRAGAQSSLRNLQARLEKAQSVATQHGSGSGDSTSSYAVPMKREGGTYVVPVRINGAITLDFTVDSGASDVSIPNDVFLTLVRTKTITEENLLGDQVYVLADGSKVKSIKFRIRSLQVGIRVLENVTGSVGGKNGSLLLGQSFLGRFRSWSIDNNRHALVLE